jgi:hypothetical protein
MRRLFLFMVSYVIFALPQLLFAQNSGSVNLNVVISQVQSLTINELQDNVNLRFSHREDFTRGVSINEQGHLNIFSSGRFVVKVSAQSDLVSPGNGKIPASTIAVTPTMSAGAPVPGLVTGSQVRLSPSEPKTIIKSPTHGTLATTFDVMYQASGEGYAQLEDGTYRTTVVYTIEVE